MHIHTTRAKQNTQFALKTSIAQYVVELYGFIIYTRFGPSSRMGEAQRLVTPRGALLRAKGIFGGMSAAAYALCCQTPISFVVFCNGNLIFLL